jgi:hypothetical protein
VYLDGGYGVGKTHLLASLWHQAPGPKLFATFVELTHLVGAIGFHIPITISLVFVALVLVGSVVASLVISPEGERTITVDLPPDFDLPKEE